MIRRGPFPEVRHSSLEQILTDMISMLEKELKSVEESNKTFIGFVRQYVEEGDIQAAEEAALFIAKEEAYAESIKMQIMDYAFSKVFISKGVAETNEIPRLNNRAVYNPDCPDSHYQERAREIVCQADADNVYKDGGQ
jgi:hypothetical protein